MPVKREEVAPRMRERLRSFIVAVRWCWVVLCGGGGVCKELLLLVAGEMWCVFSEV